MSVYFPGSKPSPPAITPPSGKSPLVAPKTGSPFAKAAPAPPPRKVVKVRAHTRTIATKPKPAPPPPPAPAKRPAAAKPPTVQPLSTSTVKRFAPNFKGEPVAGQVGAFKNPDGTWSMPGTKPQPGAYVAERSYYTDANTLKRKAGPAGQESTQWNANQVATAKTIQRANYGEPGYIVRSLIPGGLNETPGSLPQSLLRAANAATTVLPGGGIGEGVKAAGLIGSALKALRVGKKVEDVAKVAPEATKATTALAKTPPPVTPPAQVVEPVSAAVVRSSLKGAKVVRGKQEAGYSLERSKRFAAARAYLDDQTLPPAERVRLAKQQLAGELPKIKFEGFNQLNEQSVEALQKYVLDNPHLLEGQKIRASDALANALTGTVPTRGELQLLEHVFGKDTAAGLASLSTHPFKDTLLSILNVPRSLMASFDLSAPFRQGLLVATRHPAIFARNFKSMVKAFGSETVYHGMLDEIRSRPTYPLMMEAKLALTELGRDVGGREEQFASDYAEKLTGGKYGPVRASGRAYTGFLDKTRADVFDHLIRTAQAQGINVQDEKFLKSLGSYVNSATGRGDLGHFQEAGKVLNAVLFSPRLLASRLNFLNPTYYARLDPFARKEALRSALQLAGTLSTLLGLASQVPGVKVVADPRNPDWGKIRIGNTRLDLAGGFQQELRLLAQLATGVAISSTTGKKLNLTAGGFGNPTRLDILQRFFTGKESPVASLVTDWLRGSNQVGQKFSWQSAAAQRMTPLIAQDAYDLYKQSHGGVNGLLAAFGGYAVGSVGIGVQTYSQKPPKGRSSGPKDIFGGSSGQGGGSDYFGSSSSSGGGSGYFGK